jgi:hypothetical protein
MPAPSTPPSVRGLVVQNFVKIHPGPVGALLAAVLLASGLCVLCGSSLSQRQKQEGTTEDTENTEQSKPKGGSRATGSCC